TAVARITRHRKSPGSRWFRYIRLSHAEVRRKQQQERENPSQSTESLQFCLDDVLMNTGRRVTPPLAPAILDTAGRRRQAPAPGGERGPGQTDRGGCSTLQRSTRPPESFPFRACRVSSTLVCRCECRWALAADWNRTELRSCSR